jgi:hypothetical protein
VERVVIVSVKRFILGGQVAVGHLDRFTPTVVPGFSLKHTSFALVVNNSCNRSLLKYATAEHGHLENVSLSLCAEKRVINGVCSHGASERGERCEPPAARAS